jgi:hypothetical protein
MCAHKPNMMDWDSALANKKALLSQGFLLLSPKKKLSIKLLSGFFLVFVLELLNTASCINEQLLTCKERM